MVTVAEPRRGIVRSGSASKSQIASFTTTWLNFTGCVPPFRTVNTNSDSVGKATRWTLRSSTGGASWRPTPAPFSTMTASSTPNPRSGSSPRSIQTGPRPSRPIPLLLHVEEAHPAELGELADVGVEHELAGKAVAELHDPALPLPEHLRIREIRRLQPRARRVVVEEVGVRVEAVNEVELEQVGDVDPDELILFYLYGVLLIVERHAVHGVDLVGGVEVGVEAVHDHDQLVGLRSPGLRVYDERPIEPLLDVLPQGRGVAVVEVHPERLGVELVDELLPRAYELEDPIHVRRMEAVEVDRVRMSILVLEHHPNPVPLRRPQGRPRYLTIVGPRRIHHTRRHLDLRLLGRQLVLTDRPSTFLALFAPVEVPYEFTRVEPRGVHLSHRAVPPVGVHVLSLHHGGPVVLPVVAESLASIGPQQPAREAHRPRGPQKVPTRDAHFLAHRRSSLRSTGPHYNLAKANLLD